MLGSFLRDFWSSVCWREMHKVRVSRFLIEEKKIEPCVGFAVIAYSYERITHRHWLDYLLHHHATLTLQNAALITTGLQDLSLLSVLLPHPLSCLMYVLYPVSSSVLAVSCFHVSPFSQKICSFQVTKNAVIVFAYGFQRVQSPGSAPRWKFTSAFIISHMIIIVTIVEYFVKLSL